VIERIAGRLGVTKAQVALAWVLSKGVVPIPGTRHIAHLEANWAANDIELDDAAVQELETTYTLGSTVGTRYPADRLAQVPPEPVPA
jgi:aryl-alcohol dehydrogenase-like predicted oxidoreductase